LVIGGFVRGLSMRDVESLCEEAGLGKTSKSTVATICAELHERFQAFCRRSLYDVNLVVLFLDAIYLPVRPSGPKEGVICAWGSLRTATGSWFRCGWGPGRARRTGSNSAAI
jgi:transposase-like protein